MTFSLRDLKTISSRQNPLVEELRELCETPASDRIFLEGPRLVEEAVKSHLSIELLAFVPTLADTPLVQAIGPSAKRCVQITPSVLAAFSDVKTPQGIVAVARKPKTEWPQIVKRAPRPIVILDGIQNAGNAATIVRTAEAAGAAGILTTPGSARLFSPKALRGAMGSSLRVPILEHETAASIVEHLTAAGYGLLASASPAADSRSFRDVDATKAWGIILGQEGHGVSDAWAAQAQRVHIPMEPPVESLNVGAAAAILLYGLQASRR